MSRPIYETEQDRKNERAVADWIECVWEVRILDGEYLDRVDWTVYDELGYRIACMEFKTCIRATYALGEFMISKAKVDAGIARGEAEGIPFLVVVQFTDEVRFWKATKTPRVEAKGRFDRNDPGDLEDCYFVPMADLKLVEPRKRKPRDLSKPYQEEREYLPPMPKKARLGTSGASARATPP